MAKVGRKSHDERPVKFGMTAYLVPGKDDRILEWLDGIQRDQRWREIKAKVDFALMVEQEGRPSPSATDQPPGNPPEWATDLIQEIRRLSSAVARLEGSGLAPTQPEPPADAPSDKSKAATAKLLAKTRE